jgi:hypothetical protein
MICASVYLLVLIRILLVHLAFKILLLQPLKSRGELPHFAGVLVVDGERFGCMKLGIS